MNTIPLIFNERQIKRTVLGGKNSIDTKVLLPCSVVLLNRGNNHYRQQTIDNLIKCGFSQIVSVENSSLSYNLEDFSQRHPQVKFVIPLEKLSIGDMINIGISECDSEFVLVLWNDIHITSNIVQPFILEKMMNYNMLCIAPVLQTVRLQPLPIEMIPNIENSVFVASPTSVIKDMSKTVYPFDFIGLYNRQKFMQLGGYDYTITTPYWQNLDFSLRAWLWGEKISISSSFKLRYDDESPLEDITADTTQLRFYLKNCAPTFKNDYSYIPKLKYFSFMHKHPANPFEALAEFNDARNWVFINRYRFKTDVTMLVNNWQALETFEGGI